MTAIEWCRNPDGSQGKTWNPIRARNTATGKRGWHCEHVHEGCRNCYAERLNAKPGDTGGTGLPFKRRPRAQRLAGRAARTTVPMMEGVMQGKNTIAGEKLMGFVQRIEAEEKLKQIHADNISAIKAEAKAAGFIPGAIAAVVKARKMKPSQFRENEDLRDLYFHAAGLADPPPLFKQIAALAGDDMGRAAIIENMKKLVPAGASIVVEIDGPPIRITRTPEGSVTAEEVKPQLQQTARGASPMPADRPVSPPPPDVTPARARKMGGEAYAKDEPITANPFPFGDKRQPEWDAGWRERAGGDGMGPDT